MNGIFSANLNRIRGKEENDYFSLSKKNEAVTHNQIREQKKVIRRAAHRLAPLESERHITDQERLQADEIVDGKLRFRGNHQAKVNHDLIQVGRENIDWGGSHVKHQEWPTQMGRFFMLRPLMKTYECDGGEKYAKAARDYIEDWIDHFDLEDITLRGNTCMDIGIRLGTHGTGGWARALNLFIDCASWDDAFVKRMLCSMDQQAHVLRKRGIPSRNWGNHRIFGLDGLLHVSLRIPLFRDSEDRVNFSCRELERAFEQQFLTDGAHVEQTRGYHQHMTDTFIYMRRLSDLIPEVEIDLSVDRLLAAIEYGVHTRPGGINDTAAEYRDNPEWVDLEKPRHQREMLTQQSAENWFPPREAVYPDAGQVFVRSSWDHNADYLAFDAAPYSQSHAHLARLGLVFRSGGRLWLADPGSFDYEMTNPFSVYGRSTAAHSTLNLEGLNQGLGDARLLRSEINEDHVFLHGVYDHGYWDGEYGWGFQDGLGRGTYGKHERMVLWIRDEYVLIFDVMMGEPENTVENVWQLAPVADWQCDADALSWHARNEMPGFFLQMIMPHPETSMDIYEGQTDPLRGWFCDRTHDDFSPAPQVVFRYPADSTFHVTLAMPMDEGQEPPETQSFDAGRGRGVKLKWADDTTDIIALSHSLCASLDEDSPFDTDSPLVWLRLGPDGQPEEDFILGEHLNYHKDA